MSDNNEMQLSGKEASSPEARTDYEMLYKQAQAEASDAERPAGSESLSELSQQQLTAMTELAELPLAVYGGLAADTLLSGTIEREHGDVDAFVLRPQVDQVVEELQKRGFDVTEHGRINGGPGKVSARRGSVQVDVTALEVEESSGRPYATVQAPTGDEYNVFFEPNMFNQPPTELEGHQVRTVSPLGQIQVREAVALNGATKPSVDAETRRLKEKYYPDRSDDELRPQIQLSEQA